VTLLLDASVALAWCITRADPSEAILAQEALNFVRLNRAEVPALWYAEVANTLLVFERAKRFSPQDSSNFLSDLATLWIEPDPVPTAQSQSQVLSLARTHQLPAYDATYLELALRLNLPLATFDQKLAHAARSAGILVFGDPG
jgi:predicted nucleic acid-binding protein